MARWKNLPAPVRSHTTSRRTLLGGLTALVACGGRGDTGTSTDTAAPDTGHDSDTADTVDRPPPSRVPDRGRDWGGAGGGRRRRREPPRPTSPHSAQRRLDIRAAAIRGQADAVSETGAVRQHVAPCRC